MPIGSDSHSSFSRSKNSSSFAGFLFLHSWSRMNYKFSKGFKSGDCAGQFKLRIPFFCINSLFNLAVFFGSLSSWKIQFSLNYRRRSFLAQGSNFVFIFFCIVPSVEFRQHCTILEHQKGRNNPKYLFFCHA